METLQDKQFEALYNLVNKKVPVRTETPDEEKIVLARDEDWGVDINSDYSD